MSNSRYSLESPDIRNTARLLNVSSAKYGEDWHSIAHSHQYAELFYIVSGEGQFCIDNKLYPVAKDQIVVVNPNVIHTELSSQTHPLEYIVLAIDGLKLDISGNRESEGYVLDFRGDHDAAACIQNMLKETRSGLPGYEPICQAYAEILLLRLLRNVSFTATSAEPLVSRQCDIVKRYIDANYKEPLNLSELSRIVHINKYYLAHAFKKEYGISPISYMLSRRIEESKYLLKETDMSLTQISRVLGFSSASYFSQSFRRAEGLSPVEYRKANRQKAMRITLPEDQIPGSSNDRKRNI